jgi:hypothetical protein
MLAVDIIQSRRGMNEVEMNGVLESGRHLYALDWSCGAYVLPPNPSPSVATFALHHGVHSPQRSSTAIICCQEDDSQTKASKYRHTIRMGKAFCSTVQESGTFCRYSPSVHAVTFEI